MDSSSSRTKGASVSLVTGSGEPIDGDEGKLDNMRAAAGDIAKSCDIILRSPLFGGGDACATKLDGASGGKAAGLPEIDWAESAGFERFTDGVDCRSSTLTDTDPFKIH
jgi:hypothetical protein